MKQEMYCLSLGLAAFFAAIDLSSAATNETATLISADLQQRSGPLDIMFKSRKAGTNDGSLNETCAVSIKHRKLNHNSPFHKGTWLPTVCFPAPKSFDADG
jgi:hypothetical protein